MTDQNKNRKAKFEPLQGAFYDVIGEAYLLEKDGKTNANILPRAYHVKFFIFLRPNEEVIKVEYPAVKHGEATEEHPVQLVYITTNKPDPTGDTGIWKAYEFEITKNESEVLILEFSVNDVETDPKPKIIFEDPIEVDPGDGSGN